MVKQPCLSDAGLSATCEGRRGGDYIPGEEEEEVVEEGGKDAGVIGR